MKWKTFVKPVKMEKGEVEWGGFDAMLQKSTLL